MAAWGKATWGKAAWGKAAWGKTGKKQETQTAMNDFKSETEENVEGKECKKAEVKKEKK